ncbi:Calm2 [Phodopus roborovskii]|uniref:Calm2 protein n=1 Tax=Phodopus roborovskii TaxID=109678 RepID=A0AAU9YUG8_PHORO|nr:Calm2 [Phodopus roborovskii]
MRRRGLGRRTSPSGAGEPSGCVFASGKPVALAACIHLRLVNSLCFDIYIMTSEF